MRQRQRKMTSACLEECSFIPIHRYFCQLLRRTIVVVAAAVVAAVAVAVAVAVGVVVVVVVVAACSSNSSCL